MFDRQITNRFFSALDNIECGSITILKPNGQTQVFQGPKSGASAHLVINDWRMIPAIVFHGDIALAETYRDGWWDSSDPTQVFLFSLQNETVLDRYFYGNAFGRLVSRIGYFFTRNTLKGSQKNIHAHYDLGNDFYALWLDPSMTYSSGIFKNESETLQDAQYRKYDRMIEFLNPSGSLLEIGCGWGGFAERALQKRDYQIKALTISKAQHEFASNRMTNNAVIALEDYRDQEGLYDHIVSIEMFEAVGEKYWPVYFSKLKSLLAHKGTAMVQTITIADAFFDRYRAGGDAIRTFIFPGGMLPSPARFIEESQKVGLRITNEFAFGQNYATTLTHWLDNFDAKIKEIKQMGFDEKFIRMWRFYLSCCIAAFRYGRTDVIQWELQHAI